MTTTILISPAASGKTAHALELVLHASRGLAQTPHLIVASGLQVRACRRRLAEMGGAIGVRVLTFDHLYAEALAAASEFTTELSDPVQFRLIRAIVEELPLVHYEPLIGRPGFIQVVRDLIGELKAARIWPETFAKAVGTLGAEASGRLSELAGAASRS